MILDHIGFNVSDFRKAKAFFEQALKPLGIYAVAQGKGWAMMGTTARRDYERTTTRPITARS